MSLPTVGLSVLFVSSPFVQGTFSWPCWRGTEHDGVSRETHWSSEGHGDPLWETQVGLGYSAVSILDGRLVTLGYDVEAGLDRIWCLDAGTGAVRWVHEYPSEIWNRAHEGGTVNTPTIDGDRVYSLNREGNLYCLDLDDGRVVWHVALREAYGLEAPTWGFAASPLVLGDRLVLNGGKVLALDKDDGSLLWTSKDYGHAYATPMPFEHEGSLALAVFNNGGVAVLDASNGAELFFDDRGASATRGVNAATPVVIDDAVFVSSMRMNGGALLALGEEALETVWETRSLRTQLSGCVRIGDCLYGFDMGILKCFSLDGEELWAERGLGNGAVTGTPDRLLVQSGEGELLVVRADPREYVELSRAKVFEEGRFWTMPVLANGLVYCRNSKGRLVCLDHRVRD